MKYRARGKIVRGGVAVLISFPLLSGWPAAAQRPRENYVRNVALCNGANQASPPARIDGCTALIAAEQKDKTPSLAIAYNNRGNAYTAMADYDHAIQDFDQSIKLNPAYSKAFNNRGVAYLRKGEYDLAIKTFDAAIDLDHDYGRAFANRAEAYLKKNEYGLASRDYDEAIRLDPGLGAAVLSGRCWARAVLGALQAALEDCNKALQSEPSNAGAYDSRALIYLKMGQFDVAIDDYNSALRADPKIASALYGRGLARFKKGDTAGSDWDISAAKAIRPNIAKDFTRYGVR